MFSLGRKRLEIPACAGMTGKLMQGRRVIELFADRLWPQLADPALRGSINYIQHTRRIETCDQYQCCEQPDDKKLPLLQVG